MIKRLLILLILLSPRVSLAEDAKLIWSNGDAINGTLVSADENVLTWKSELFSNALQIRQSSLAAVEFPKSEPAVVDEKLFRILMRNGDVLFGLLKSVGETTFTFEGPRFGVFEVNRDHVLSLQRATNSGGVIYSGPRGLDGWQSTFRRSPDQNRQEDAGFRNPNGQAERQRAADAKTKPSAWTEEIDGSITTTRPDAALFLPQKLPERFEIELELHSKRMLSFVLAIGRDAKTGLRLESWIDVLVAANGTKFATLQQISEKEQTIHLHLFVDHSAKKMTVYSLGGEKLGEVETSGLRGAAEGLTLRNGEWDLSLRRLRISHWDGQEPKFSAGKGTRIQMLDGSVHSGTLGSSDADSMNIVLKKDDADVPLALDGIASMVLTGENDGQQVPRGSTQVAWSDGGFVSGTLLSVSDGLVRFQTPYCSKPVECRLQDATRMGMTPGSSEAGQTEPAQSDRLYHKDGSLQGSLVVDGAADAPIQWRPLGGVTASPLQNGGDARFVRGAGLVHFSEHPEMLANFPDVIYLRNNDVLPCKVVDCTDDDVRLTLPFSDVKSFARSEVRALELDTSGRIHQRGFHAPGWKGFSSGKKRETMTFKGNVGYSHPSILTGDTVRFHLKWPIQSYSNLTISMYGDGNRKSEESTEVSFTLMQATMQVLDRAPQQDQMFFRGFGGQNTEGIIRVPKGEVDVQLVARDGKLLVSVDGEQVKTLPLNAKGAGLKGLAFNGRVTMMGNVVINGRVQQGSGDGVEISAFEVDNLSGASIRQFIEEEARQAALTVPRFRRDNPPTHVLVASNGDLLRGQLKGFGEGEMLFESRLEELRISRDRVAAIVWLDPPKKEAASPSPEGEAEPEKKPESESVSGIRQDTVDPAVDSVAEKTTAQDDESGFVYDDAANMMHAGLSDGFCITMTPVRLVDGQIKGTSPLLGECTFPAATIRELYLGDIRKRDQVAAYEQWIARSAPEPDWDVAADDGGNSAGSQMIGKVAEDFELPLLDGTTFRLKDHADKIVVLDFWATWCGPCVAALPDYIAATGEFDASKVIFVAVNQQEASDQIRSFLAERDLSLVVALDREGSVGQKFHVSGIPHTVILGPGNMVEDVHVGYQQGGGESMQMAIQQMLDGTWKRPEPNKDAQPDPASTDAI